MTAAPTTVLLVDDEPHVLAALRRTLRAPELRVLTAGDAEEALRLLAEGGVDVLVSDIDMPGMSGIELIREVRRRNPEIVRLLLTGDASLESALDAINHGEVYRYLLKPWKAAELRQTLADAIARLHELRAAARAAVQVSAREQMLAELEREHPGIRADTGEGGVYRLDPGRLDAVAASLGAPAVAAFLAPLERGGDGDGGTEKTWT